MELDTVAPTSRYKLLKLLGGQCRMCPITEIKDLEVDHIFYDGAEERTRYGSSEKIYGWYLEHHDQAFKRLQPLCKEHHRERHNTLECFRFHKKLRDFSKIDLFMVVLKNLEGESKTPISKEILIVHLVETDKFTHQEAENYIRKMQRESSIYESKAGSYNRV